MILTCGLVYAIINFWLCMINDLLRVIIFGIEDNAIVNHRGFGSYNTKQVKSSINHLPLCPSKRAACMIASLFSKTKKLNFSFFLSMKVSETLLYAF